LTDGLKQRVATVLQAAAAIGAPPSRRRRRGGHTRIISRRRQERPVRARFLAATVLRRAEPPRLALQPRRMGVEAGEF
jgi:3-phenylpropionate/cinnamic acid dioxygenase small subunit